MSRAHAPDLKEYLDKEVNIKLNSNRCVQGVFRGYDAFMNITLHNVYEIISKDEIVSYKSMVVRGNSISSFSDPIELNKSE